MDFLKADIQTIILSPRLASCELGYPILNCFKDLAKKAPFSLIKQVGFWPHLQNWLDEGPKYELGGQIVDML